MILARPLEDLLGPLTVEHVQTADGVRLQVQRFGRGPAVLLANGIGVRFPGMALQIAALRQRYEVITWDYRGTGQSVMNDPDGDINLPRHAQDVLAVLDQLQLPQALIIGWSMGLPVGLELIRVAPERVAGLVALLGSFGLPFRTSSLAPVASAMERGFAFLQHHPALPQAALHLAVSFPRLAFAVLSQIRFVGSDADPLVFGAAVRSVAGVEMGLYMRTLLALSRHSAADLLPHISCPTLVICGRRDYLTPPLVARYMAREIPGAEYQEVCSGTHFSLLEQPDLVNSWLMDFCSRVLCAQAADEQSPEPSAEENPQEVQSGR